MAEAERPKNLPHGSWHGDFPRLSPAEKRLLECARTGKQWAPTNWNGKRPEKGTAANRLRAGLIRFLLLGGDAEHPVHRRGLSIEGAWIADALDLEELRSEFRLGMFACHFAQPIMLRNGRLAALILHKSSFPGLDAQGAAVKGNVFLRNTEALGAVSLAGASIGGQLACEGAKFDHTDNDGSATGLALNAEGAEVNGHVFLGNVDARGEVSLASASIGGQLSCVGAKFRHADKDGNAKGHALKAHSAVVKGGVFLRNAETFGEVNLLGASIGGQLSCIGAKFRHADKDGNATGRALNAQGADVKGGVFLGNTESLGEICLSGALIGGQLACVGAKFRHADKDGNATGKALNAQNADVKGGVFLEKAESLGEVSLPGASIGGQLACVGAKFCHADKDGKATGKALNVQSAEMKGSAILGPAEIVGTIDFTAATISDLEDSPTAWPQGTMFSTD